MFGIVHFRSFAVWLSAFFSIGIIKMGTPADFITQARGEAGAIVVVPPAWLAQFIFDSSTQSCKVKGLPGHLGTGSHDSIYITLSNANTEK